MALADIAYEDLQTFAIAFTIVWGALAAYLLYLHRLERRIETELSELKASIAKGK
jgi:CcmD family protein